MYLKTLFIHIEILPVFCRCLPFACLIYVFSLISVGLNCLIQIDGNFRCNSNAYILNLGQNIF